MVIVPMPLARPQVKLPEPGAHMLPHVPPVAATEKVAVTGHEPDDRRPPRALNLRVPCARQSARATAGEEAPDGVKPAAIAAVAINRRQISLFPPQRREPGRAFDAVRALSHSHFN